MFLGLRKHDRPVAVQEHPSLDKGLDGARERDAFDVASDREQLLRPVRMIDALDCLLDDRSFVEIVGDEMRRRADQLDAPRMRLVIRLRALEARQEGVVDVDRAMGESAAGLGGQHLHVACEDHKFGAARLEQVEPLRFLFCLRLRRDREMPEREIVLPGERLQVGMVRSNADDVHLQFAHAPAEQQIREAMLEPGHHDQYLRARARVVDRPLHAEAVRYRRELLPQHVNARRLCVRRMEYTAQEEAVAQVVIENGQFVDVAAVALQQADDCGHLAGGARARQRENEAL
ncbi:conserved hypothetical protein [Cupriavidus taiwanensis]|uniref:Uncharacterized protein n=1 Tax=Cupriavidus taiwanensis TaxID=164546 RepID=A0A375CRD3_9BURK|nr:conserved hypothetical protein [Cupriavidus taiwanensis]